METIAYPINFSSTVIQANGLLTAECFDWSSSDRLNPFQISVSHQSNEMSYFLSNFTHAKTFTSATADQYAHLMHVLQCTLISFGRYVSNLKKKIKLLKKQSRKENIESPPTTKTILKKEKFLCPVCLESIKSLDILDRHMKERHAKSVDAWNSLRCDELLGSKVNNQAASNSTEIMEMYMWMNEKFNYLEALLYEKIRKKKNPNHKKKSQENPTKPDQIGITMNPEFNTNNPFSNPKDIHIDEEKSDQNRLIKSKRSKSHEFNPSKKGNS